MKYKIGSPEQYGINSRNIQKLFLACEERIHYLYTFSIMRGDTVLAEGYRSPYGKNELMDCLSIGKSLVSVAVGILEAEKKLSLDDLLLDYFRELLPRQYDPRLEGLRVRHLLTMSASSAARSTPFLTLGEQDWGSFYLGLPLPDEPGRSFSYDTGASYMLSRLVTKLTGKSLLDYLKEHVFHPMGIQNVWWLSDPQGITAAGWGLYLAPADMMKLGILFSNYGQWKGRQLIPEDWMKRAVSCQIDTSSNPGLGWKHGYGYQFWIGEYGTFLSFGGFGQLIICQPESKLIVTTTAGCSFEETQLMGDLIHREIFKEASDDALPENPTACRELAQYLAHWHYPYPDGEAAPLEASQWAGTYLLNENPLDLEKISFKETSGHMEIRLTRAQRTYCITAGFHSWELFIAPIEAFPRRQNGFSYAWQPDMRLVIYHCCINTPYVRTYNVRFTETGITVEITQNFSLLQGNCAPIRGYRTAD